MIELRSSEWEQLRRYAQILHRIQDKLFEQIDDNKITDDVAEAEGAANEPMVRIFAIESALVSLGALSSVSTRLRTDSKYFKLEEDIQYDEVLRDLSIDFLRGKTR